MVVLPYHPRTHRLRLDFRGLLPAAPTQQQVITRFLPTAMRANADVLNDEGGSGAAALREPGLHILIGFG